MQITFVQSEGHGRARPLGEYEPVTHDIEQAGERPERAPDVDPARTARGEHRFRILVAGYSLSSYGTFLNMVALNLFVYETTGRALAMGLFMAVRLASGFVAGLAAGGLLARFTAKSLMLWTNVAQAAVMLTLVFAPQGMRTAALMAVSVVVGSCGTLFMVSLRSSIPEMVGDDRRSWANSSPSPGVHWPWWPVSPRQAWWSHSSATPPRSWWTWPPSRSAP